MFSLVGTLPLTIPAGASGALPLRFAPSASGPFSAHATIGFDLANPLVVPLTGSGATPLLPGGIDTPDTLDFGTVTAAATRTLAIGNDGAGPLTVTAAALDTGSRYALTPAALARFQLRIAPGAAEAIQVECSPLAGDSGQTLRDRLRLTTDDPDEPLSSVALAAKVAAPADPAAATALALTLTPDPIGAADCAAVSGRVQFGPDSRSADRFTLVLRDEQGGEFRSVAQAAGAGTSSLVVAGLDACALADGAIEPRLEVLRNGTDPLPVFVGSVAVKNAGPLAAPVLADTATVVTLDDLIRLCGSARSQTLIDIKGGARTVALQLGAGETSFCLDVPLRPNTEP